MQKWFRQRDTGSRYIREFVERLYGFQQENPDELCPPETDLQLVVNCLKDALLGVNWYLVLPVSTKQINTEILCEILREYSGEYRKLVEESRKKAREHGT